MPRPLFWRRRRHLDLGAGVGEPDAPADELTYGGMTVREYCDAIEQGQTLSLSARRAGAKAAFREAVRAELSARGHELIDARTKPDTLDGQRVAMGDRDAAGDRAEAPAMDPASWAACRVVADERIPKGRAVLISGVAHADPVTIGVDFGTDKAADAVVPVTWGADGTVIGEAKLYRGERGVTFESTVYGEVSRWLAETSFVPSIGFPPTPQQRRELQIENDKAIHGNAFIGPDGQRIDPRTVQTMTTGDPPRIVGYRVQDGGDDRIYDPLDVVHETRGADGIDLDVIDEPPVQWSAADVDRARGILNEHTTTVRVVDRVSDQIRTFADRLASIDNPGPFVPVVHPHEAPAVREYLERRFGEDVDRRVVVGDGSSTQDDVEAAALRAWRERAERWRVIVELLAPYREGGLGITGASDFTGTRSPEREKNPVKKRAEPAESGLKPGSAEHFAAWCERHLSAADEPLRLEPWQRQFVKRFMEER